MRGAGDHELFGRLIAGSEERCRGSMEARRLACELVDAGQQAIARSKALLRRSFIGVPRRDIP